MNTRCLMSCVIILMGAANLRAQDGARAIIDRAIQAHGGTERLGRIRADRIEAKGNVFIDGAATPFENVTTVQLPGQFKSVLRITTAKSVNTVVQILNGDKAFVTVDGTPQKVEPTALAGLRETLQLDRAVRLVPLVTDRMYTIKELPEVKINDRSALGVHVTAKGRKALDLYFDKETALLVKTEHSIDAPDGKAIKQEVYYGNFRDVGGYKRPMKLVYFRDGKKVMEAEVTDVKYFDKIEDEEFAKP